MTHIQWIPPEPRAGWLGLWDKFVGPGATSSEEWVQFIGGVLLSTAVGFALFHQREALGWSMGQVALVGLLVLDLTGGIITNATAAAKRWYHRPGQHGIRAHMPFIAVHGLHLLAIAIFFREGDWVFFGALYGYLLAAALVIVISPLYLQRPISLILLCGGLLIGMYAFVPTSGLEWFVPFFYLKLLVSHLVKEAPFTPESI